MGTLAGLPVGLTPLLNPDDMPNNQEIISLDKYTINLYVMRVLSTKAIHSAIQSIVISRKVTFESIVESIKEFIVCDNIGHINKTLTLSQITIIRKLIYKLYPLNKK